MDQIDLSSILYNYSEQLLTMYLNCGFCMALGSFTRQNFVVNSTSMQALANRELLKRILIILNVNIQA